jgi:oligopeptide transport system substrate-binding protein
MGRGRLGLARLGALVVAFALVFPIATFSTLAQDSAGDKILRVHFITDPDVVDPQRSSYSNEIAVLALNYEGLTRQDESLQTVGAAAESWEYNEDATVLTFHLRDGLMYSDGSPLTAANFEYAVKRNCDPRVAGEYQSILFEIEGCAEFASLYAEQEGATPVAADDEAAYQAARDRVAAKAIDDRTFELRLVQSAPYYHTIAALWVFFPAKQELVEQGGEDWWQDPSLQIGNGPFQITEYEPDQIFAFKANENYWAGRPKLDGIEYRYIADVTVAIEAYRNGDVDIVDVDPGSIPTVKGDAELSQDFVTYAFAATYDLAYNLSLEPFNDKKVREAFSMAFDRETYCAEVRNGDCTSTLSWVPDGIPGSVEWNQFGFDPEAAKQALAESSYGGPEALPEIKLYYNNDNAAAATARAEWVAGQYRDVLGVNIVLEPTEGTTLSALRKDPATFPQLLLVGGWIQDYPDPQNWLSVYWTCEADFAEQQHYCNPEFDNLINQADTTLDPQARIQLYEQAHRLLLEDLPVAFLYNQANAILIRPQITGYTATALDVEWPGQFASLLTVDINR